LSPCHPSLPLLIRGAGVEPAASAFKARRPYRHRLPASHCTITNCPATIRTWITWFRARGATSYTTGQNAALFTQRSRVDPAGVEPASRGCKSRIFPLDHGPDRRTKLKVPDAGIEPATQPWHGRVIPLHQPGDCLCLSFCIHHSAFTPTARCWNRTSDSSLEETHDATSPTGRSILQHSRLPLAPART
jgi:hypothetical protein